MFTATTKTIIASAIGEAGVEGVSVAVLSIPDLILISRIGT